MKEESPKAIFYALAANLGIAVCKFGAAAFTGSGSMFAEAIHSTADCGNQVLLLVGIKQAQTPADALHPLGSGREIYFYSMVVALLLIAVSFLSNGWSAFRLLLTVFLLLAIPVVVGIVTWLRHGNYSEINGD